MDSRAHSFYREYLMNECALNELNEECHFVSQFDNVSTILADKVFGILNRGISKKLIDVPIYTGYAYSVLSKECHRNAEKILGDVPINVLLCTLGSPYINDAMTKMTLLNYDQNDISIVVNLEYWSNVFISRPKRFRSLFAESFMHELTHATEMYHRMNDGKIDNAYRGDITKDAKSLGYIMNMSEIFATLNEASKRVKSMNDEELKKVLERGKALKVGSSSDTLGACYILIKYCEDILFLKIFKDLILKFKKAIDEDDTKECYSLYVIGCHLVAENNLHHHSIRLLKDQVSEEEFGKSPSKDKCLRCIIRECEQRYEFKKKRAITMFYYILRKRNLT